MSFATVCLLIVFTASTCIYVTQAEAPSKGDRGIVVTETGQQVTSSTGARNLVREATYGTQIFYPPSGNNKGYSRTSNSGYQVPVQAQAQAQGYQKGYSRTSNSAYQGPVQAQAQAQGYQKGYPSYGGNTGYGGYGNQGIYEPQNQGGYQTGYIANQPGYGVNQPGYGVNQPSYGNNKGWSAPTSGWAGNNRGGSWSSPNYQGNYKGSSGVRGGWYGGQNDHGSGWYGGNQVRPDSGGYNWPPSSGYRGEKGYSGSNSGNWGYGTQGGGYGGGYGNQGSNKGGLGNQIYGSGYGGSYVGGNQKGWSNNPGYGNAVPNQGGWGYYTSNNYGYNQGYNKGSSNPRLNTVESKPWSDTRSGYANYPNNKGWW